MGLLIVLVLHMRTDSEWFCYICWALTKVKCCIYITDTKGYKLYVLVYFPPNNLFSAYLFQWLDYWLGPLCCINATGGSAIPRFGVPYSC